MQADTGCGVEPARDAPHPVTMIHPGPQPRRPPLPLQPAHPVIGLDPTHLSGDRRPELVRRGSFRDPDQPVGSFDERVVFARFQLPQGPAGYIDRGTRHDTVGEGLPQLRQHPGGLDPLHGPLRGPSASYARHQPGPSPDTRRSARPGRRQPRLDRRARPATAPDAATTRANTPRSRQAGSNPPTASTSSCTAANSIRTTVRKGCYIHRRFVTAAPEPDESETWSASRQDAHRHPGRGRSRSSDAHRCAYRTAHARHPPPDRTPTTTGEP